jgi:hypothetical protein
MRTERGSGARASGTTASSNRDVGGAPIAGWVLAQFVTLDPPSPIPDYANASGMRIVAWGVLNTVPDASGDKPQFVVAGARGGKPVACDFSALRVFTWGARRQRYETAYVENDLCGRLPIVVRSTPAGPEFHFPDAAAGGAERTYRMRQTIVRRVRDTSGSGGNG